MLKFYVVKRAEGDRNDAIDSDMEFKSFEDFLQWANYHRAYIAQIQTLEGEMVGDPITPSDSFLTRISK